MENTQMTEKQLREMIETYLEHGDFEVSEYARVEFAGLTAMLAQPWAHENLERIDFDGNDFDALSDFAHEKARAENLIPGHDYR